MKRLGLLRHAKSDWDDMALRDFDRGLNERGRIGAALMGKHIREYGAKWDLTFASPAQRVRQTLTASKLEYPVSFFEGLYLADSTTMQEQISDLDNADSGVLLVGHNPGLQDLIFDLVAFGEENPLLKKVEAKFPTAAFAILELDIERWKDIKDSCAKLVHFARPRDLDPELGPMLGH